MPSKEPIQATVTVDLVFSRKVRHVTRCRKQQDTGKGIRNNAAFQGHFWPVNYKLEVEVIDLVRVQE